MFHFPALFKWAIQYDGPSPLSFAQFPALFPFFRWVDGTAICNYIKGTTWIFPLVETIHILSLVVLVGSVLLVDFRLLGIGLSRWTPKDMARQLAPYMRYGLITILVTGTLLFIAEPRKLYDNAAFGPKMLLLALSIIFQYTIFRKMETIDLKSPPIWSRLGALLSLALWFGVGIAGRAIGFV
jgi:hypothetical protein